MRNHTKMRYLINPLNTFYSTIKVATNPLERTNAELSKIGQDAKIITPPAETTAAPILLLVVGETARSESFGLNGYERNTTPQRSEEHTSELQSPCNLVCRLLLEKKKRRE